MTSSPLSNSRFFIGFVLSSLLFGSAAFAIGAVNTPESGYVLCVSKKTQAVTFPGTDKCPKGSSRLLIGAQGIPGIKGEKGDKGDSGVMGATGPKGDSGLTGPAGAAGAPGLNGTNGTKGSSLLTGVGAPMNSLGENGDTYIDKNAAYIYGPKSSGIWGYGTSFAGPAGATGPSGSNGISQGYFKNLTSDIYLNNNNNTVVASIAVPAGKYFVFYNTNWLSFDGNLNYFGCDFVNTSSDASGKTVVSPPSRDSYSKNGFVVVPSGGGNIQVHCRLLYHPANIFALYHGSLNVIALDMVSDS